MFYRNELIVINFPSAKIRFFQILTLNDDLKKL